MRKSAAINGSKQSKDSAKNFDENDIDTVVEMFSFDDKIDFFSAIGSGKLDITKVREYLRDAPLAGGEPSGDTTQKPLSVLAITDTTDARVEQGQCCKPFVGDDIIGTKTRDKLVTIHRRNCSLCAKRACCEQVFRCRPNVERYKH